MDSERIDVTVDDIPDEEGPAETPMRELSVPDQVWNSPAVQQHLTRGGRGGGLKTGSRQDRQNLQSLGDGSLLENLEQGGEGGGGAGDRTHTPVSDQQVISGLFYVPFRNIIILKIVQPTSFIWH